jgi:glycogen synthase
VIEVGSRIQSRKGQAELRIALIGDYPPPFGGVSVHVAALAAALRSRRADVRVLDIGRGDHTGEGIVPARGGSRFLAELARVAQERRLVHVHTSGANAKSWLVALAASLARLPGSPSPLLTLHSGLLPDYLGSRRGGPWVARHVCSRFGHVLAVSAMVAGALEGAGVPRSLLSVQPAFLAAQLEPGVPPRPAQVFRDAHRPLFCAAVAPSPTYGEDLLLQAFRAVRQRLPGAGLVLFGEGLPGFRARPERESRTAPGASSASLCSWRGRQVLALGEIEHSAALGVISLCDVFVRATRADGDALSVREALALGCAVVASDGGHRPPGCVLFRADDARNLVERMLEAAHRRPPCGAERLPVRDSLERILSIYRALARGRPISTDSTYLEQVPGWTR